MNTIDTLRCLVDSKFFLTQAVAAIVERMEESLPDVAGLPALKPTPGFELTPHAPYRTASPPRGILLDPKPPRWFIEPPPPSSPGPGLGAAAVILSLAYLCVKYLGPLLERQASDDASLPKSVWHPGWVEKTLLKPLTQHLEESRRALYSHYLQRQGWFYTHANDVAGLQSFDHRTNPRLFPQTEDLGISTTASADIPVERAADTAVRLKIKELGAYHHRQNCMGTALYLVRLIEEDLFVDSETALIMLKKLDRIDHPIPGCLIVFKHPTWKQGYIHHMGVIVTTEPLIMTHRFGEGGEQRTEPVAAVSEYYAKIEREYYKDAKFTTFDIEYYSSSRQNP